MNRALLVIAGLMLSSAVRAQEIGPFPAERLRPAMDREGIADLEWAEIGPHLTWDAALWLNYSLNPVTVYRNDGSGGFDRVGALVRHRIGANIIGGISLFDVGQIGLDIPMTLVQERSDAPGPGINVGGLSAGGFGDLRLIPKIQAARAADIGVDIAVLTSITFPTNAPKDRYMGERTVTWVPEVAVGRRLGPLRIGGNIGYRLRGSASGAGLRVGDEIILRAGGAWELHNVMNIPLAVGGTISGAVSAVDPGAKFNRNPWELLAQATYDWDLNYQLFGGLGVGLVAGVGTPDFRIFIGGRYSPRDADKDRDRIPDTADKCPETAEDHDDFEDEDGCPEGDNDEDGILDDDDECPNDPEDKNDFRDEDGCPDEDERKVELTETTINIQEKILFEVGKSTIDTQSFKVLDQVAEILREQVHITEMRIEGHTDATGDDEDNLYLSQDRADAVRRYLIKKGGIDKKRLKATGFGETKPKAGNDTAEGREQNRRVEFVITEVNGEPVGAPQ